MTAPGPAVGGVGGAPPAGPPVGPPPPVASIVPAPDFLNPPAGPIMTPKAAGCTYEQFIAKGWTDAQLIQQGYMVG